jgi:hypothetical protein
MRLTPFRVTTVVLSPDVQGSSARPGRHSHTVPERSRAFAIGGELLFDPPQPAAPTATATRTTAVQRREPDHIEPAVSTFQTLLANRDTKHRKRSDDAGTQVRRGRPQRSGWSGPVSRNTWIARFGESTSLAAGSLRVQPTSGDRASSVVKKTRLEVVTTYW